MVDAIGKPAARTGNENAAADPKLRGKDSKDAPGIGPEVVVNTAAKAAQPAGVRTDAIREYDEAENTAQKVAGEILQMGPASAEIHNLTSERVEQLTSDAA